MRNLEAKRATGAKRVISLLCFSLRARVEIAPGIARGDSTRDHEKKARACFHYTFSFISVKITDENAK